MRTVSTRANNIFAYIGPEDESIPTLNAGPMLYKKTEGGLSYKDLEPGSESAVAEDAIVSIKYTATRMSTGEVVERTGSRPLTFERGNPADAPPIFNEAVQGMRPGGTRRVLVLPSSQYAMLKDDTIDFEIELVEVKTGAAATWYKAQPYLQQAWRAYFFFVITQVRSGRCCCCCCAAAIGLRRGCHVAVPLRVC